MRERSDRGSERVRERLSERVRESYLKIDYPAENLVDQIKFTVKNNGFKRCAESGCTLIIQMISCQPASL